MEAAASLTHCSVALRPPPDMRVDFHCGKKNKRGSQRNILDITHLESQSHHLVVSGIPVLPRLPAQARQSPAPVPLAPRSPLQLPQPLPSVPQGAHAAAWLPRLSPPGRAPF